MTTVQEAIAVDSAACLDKTLPRGHHSHELSTRCAGVSLTTDRLDNVERTIKRRTRMTLRALAFAWGERRKHNQGNLLAGPPAEPVLATCGSTTLNFEAFPTSSTETTIGGLTTDDSNRTKLLLYITAVQARLALQHEKILIADSAHDDAVAHVSIAALHGADELDVEANAQPLLSAVPGTIDANMGLVETPGDDDADPSALPKDLVDVPPHASPKLTGVPNTAVDNDSSDSDCTTSASGALELLQSEESVATSFLRPPEAEREESTLDSGDQESHHKSGCADAIGSAEGYDAGVEGDNALNAALVNAEGGELPHSDAYDGCYTYNESYQSSVYSPEPWSYSGEEPIWDFSMVGYENPFADPREDSGASELQEFVPLEEGSAEAAFWGEARKPVCNIEDKIFETDFTPLLDRVAVQQSDYAPPVGDIDVVEDVHTLNKNVYTRYDFGMDVPVIEISPPPQDFASVTEPPPNEPIPLQDEAFGYQLAVVGTRQAACRSTVSVVATQNPEGQPMYSYMIYEHDQWKPAYSCQDGAKTTLAWYVQDPDGSWRRVRPRDVQMF